MANEKDTEVKPTKEAAKVEPKKPAPAQAKMKFLVWFSGEWKNYAGCKPHHLQAITAFFKSIDLAETSTPSEFDQGMKKFGFGRK